MDKHIFDAVFPIISSALVEKIKEELKLSDEEAVSELYSSKIYKILENEKTKLWQYSTEKLLDMFLEEKYEGKINFPEI